jgi:hypothetical protein
VAVYHIQLALTFGHMKTFWTPEADFKVIVVVGGNENPHSEHLWFSCKERASWNGCMYNDLIS